MKLFKDVGFLLRWYDKEDLLYFYEQLQNRITNTVKSETTDNEKLQGYIWKIMATTIERCLPQSRRYTRINEKQREEFCQLISDRMKDLNVQYQDYTITKQERETILFSLYAMKFLLALAKHDDLF